MKNYSKRIFFLVLVPSVLFLHCQEKQTFFPESSRLMPSGFEHMHLGMDESDLMRMKGLDFDSEWCLYYVSISNPNDSFMQYLYFSNKPVSYIRFQGKGKEDFLPGFIAGCLEKWGDDFQRKINYYKVDNVTYYYPMLGWEKNDATILASFTSPLNEKRADPGYIYYFVEFYPPHVNKCRWTKGKVKQVNSEYREYFRQIDSIDALINGYEGPLFR